jgi:hypothetical protein
VHSDGSVAEAGKLVGEFEGVFAFFEIGACDHHFGDAGCEGASDDVLEVIFVGFFAVVHATEYLVGEVDADLFWRCVNGGIFIGAKILHGRLCSVELVCLHHWWLLLS